MGVSPAPGAAGMICPCSRRPDSTERLSRAESAGQSAIRPATLDEILQFVERDANYGYLEDLGLFSPRAGVTVKPSERDPLTLRASVSHRSE